jgi:alpha-tubulin suppressor-like RCC1 family protein
MQCQSPPFLSLPFLTPRSPQFGPLGTGTTTASTSLVPVLAPGAGAGILTGATDVAAAGRPEAAAPSGHTCACLSSGQAVCWGQNTWGQVR